MDDSIPQFSFELFPPRTPEAAAKLPAGDLASWRQCGPDYFSVTHGAGGSDQDGTYETLLDGGASTRALKLCRI